MQSPLSVKTVYTITRNQFGFMKKQKFLPQNDVLHKRKDRNEADRT
jgi:hypothetical protein